MSNKKTKADDLRVLSIDDLAAKAKQINDDIFKTRMQMATGGITNKHAIVSKRRELARVKTVLNQKIGGQQ